MAEAANLNIELPMLLPGIKIQTSSKDYFPIKQMQLQEFDGEKWLRFGPVIKGEVTVE